MATRHPQALFGTVSRTAAQQRTRRRTQWQMISMQQMVRLRL